MIKRNKWFFCTIITIGIAFTVLLTFTSGYSKEKSYGAIIDTKKGTIAELNKIMVSPVAYEGKNVIVQGKTGQICQTSGCWVLITDGTSELFVQFYTFTIRPSKGSTVRVQGVLKFRNKVPYLAAEGLEIIN